jgi:hypothetical protein
VTGAAAQDKNELAGSIGRTFVSNQGVPGANFFDNEIHFGNGLSFEVTYGRRILGSQDSLVTLTAEVPFVVNPDQDLNFGMNVIPESYSSFFVTPAARVNLFANTAISPWVSFGGGFGHFSESSNLVFFGPNTGQRGTTTGVYRLGAGLDVKVHGKLSLRGEFRDFNSGCSAAECRHRQEPPAQLFCRRRSCLALLDLNCRFTAGQQSKSPRIVPVSEMRLRQSLRNARVRNAG